MNNERKYVVYDGRAMDGDTESASILCTAGSLKEARSDAKYFSDGVIYSYRVEPTENPLVSNLVDKRFEETI